MSFFSRIFKQTDANPGTGLGRFIEELAPPSLKGVVNAIDIVAEDITGALAGKEPAADTVHILKGAALQGTDTMQALIESAIAYKLAAYDLPFFEGEYEERAETHILGLISVTIDQFQAKYAPEAA